MGDKICLVTGANSGIGFEIAKRMAENKYKTILICRNKLAGEVAKNRIINHTKNNDIYLMIADLSSQMSIKKFVREFNSKFDHLDVLFNNAGANFFSHQLSKDGIEMTFAVNYLAPFLLTNLLFPTMKNSKTAKIILTVGGISNNTAIQFDNINFEDNYNVVKASGQSILAKFLFCYELNRRLKGTNITINCFNPGATKTDLQKKMPFTWRILTGIIRPFFQSAKTGAKTGIYLATSKEVENISGKYFKNFKELKSTNNSYDKELAKQLWEISEKMIQKH